MEVQTRPASAEFVERIPIASPVGTGCSAGPATGRGWRSQPEPVVTG